MSRIRYDQLFKQHLEEFLEPLGRVERSYEIPGEPLSVDLWFQPDETNSARATASGLLGAIAKRASVIEPYSQPPNRGMMRRCLYKLFHIQNNVQRQQSEISEDGLPRLWILPPTLSEILLNDVGAVRSREYLRGVYELPAAFCSYIIVIHQLPETPETVRLRVIGKGQVQQRAIAEIMAMPVEDKRRATALRVLSNWKVISEQVGVENEEDEVFAMALSQAFLELEQEIRQQSREDEARSLVLRLLTRRLGSVSEEEQAQITALPLEQLEALGEALLDFRTVEDLRAWLSTNGQQSE
jgi:hypothetical protein